jgi:hypothetical protein
MSVFTDPLFLRGMERIILVAAAAYLGLLGYKLFLYGMACGRTVSRPQSQLVTALYSGAAPGLFFMAVAASVVLMISLTGNPPAHARSGPAAVARGADKADMLKQIDLLKQTEKVRGDVILGLRSQLALARTNNAVPQEVVDQIQQSLNTASTPAIDYNSLYTQMTEMNDAITELQTENDTLRQENTTLRAQGNPQ